MNENHQCLPDNNLCVCILACMCVCWGGRAKPAKLLLAWPNCLQLSLFLVEFIEKPFQIPLRYLLLGVGNNSFVSKCKECKKCKKCLRIIMSGVIFSFIQLLLGRCQNKQTKKCARVCVRRLVVGATSTVGFLSGPWWLRQTWSSAW